MLNIVQCDITSITHGIVGHQVNCMGYMGAGVAQALRDKDERVFTEYRQFRIRHHKRHDINTSQGLFKSEQSLLGLCNFVKISPTLVIANIFGQHKTGEDGRYTRMDALERGLSAMYEYALLVDLPVFLPLIGSGLGGADWDTEVAPAIERINSYYPQVDTTICTL